MKSDLKVGVFGLVMMAAAIGLAAPQVALDRVQQRYPWNGLVDIDYTITGVEGYDVDYRLEFAYSSSEGEGTMSRFAEVAGCDLPTANGTHRVTWNAAADGLDFMAKDFRVTARLVCAPVTESEADYLIIDLSSGKNSTEYPVRFVRTGFDYSTENFNCHLYKQSKLVLKRVPACSFWMGTGNVSSGTKRHKVRLSKGCWLGVFEVTQGQYTLVVGSNPSAYPTDTGSELAKERPVEKLNLDTIIKPSVGFMDLMQARVKCRGKVLGGFNVPTEAQWECACRAGCENAYYWGADTEANIDDYEWTKQNANSLTHVVGLKLPNDWGFYDMLGNVWEWTRDWEWPYPAYEEDGETVDPLAVVAHRRKVMRGGAFHPNLPICGSGTRTTSYNATPNMGNPGYNPALINAYGFRLCKEVK